MSEIDTVRLKVLAEKASKGPWRLEWDGQDLVLMPGGRTDATNGITQWLYAIAPWRDSDKAECDTADPDYIAAANPATVIALLDRLDTAESLLDAAKDALRDVMGELREVSNIVQGDVQTEDVRPAIDVVRELKLAMDLRDPVEQALIAENERLRAGLRIAEDLAAVGGRLLQRAEAERDAAKDALRLAREALNGAEWVRDPLAANMSYPFCPWCLEPNVTDGKDAPVPHLDDCERDIALAAINKALGGHPC